MSFNIFYKTLLSESILDFHLSNFSSNTSINDLIILFYELEYKRQAVIVSSANEIRKDKVLERIDEKLLDLIKILKEKFAVIFSKWIYAHAVLDPHQWAVNRVHEDLGDSSIEDILFALAFEYYKYEYLEKKKEVEYNKEEILTEIFKKMHKLGFEEITDVDDEFDYIVNKMELDEQEDILIKIYKFIVFPIWIKFWRLKNIQDTERYVKTVYNNLIKKTSNNIDEEIGNISIILNTAHQNGKLIDDYYNVHHEEKDDLDKVLLKKLTDGSYEGFRKWEREIRESGF